MTATHHQIKDLRQANLQRLLEALVVMVTAFSVSAFLPSILIRYYYANQQLMEQPKLLEILPVVTFAISMGYVVYVLVANYLNSAKIAKLHQQAAMDSHGCCGGNCGGHGANSVDEDKELAELEKLVDEAIAEAEKAAKKSSSTKKSTKKKSSTKKSSKKS